MTASWLEDALRDAAGDPPAPPSVEDVVRRCQAGARRRRTARIAAAALVASVVAVLAAGPSDAATGHGPEHAAAPAATVSFTAT